MNKYESEQLLKKKINEKNKKKFYRNNMYMCKCMCIYMYVCVCIPGDSAHTLVQKLSFRIIQLKPKDLFNRDEKYY